MRLFHVSEESDITLFKPIKPYRKDMENSPPLVWAINERCLPNFLTPRNCPRVTYHVRKGTKMEDRDKYFSSRDIKHVVAIEHKWFEVMNNTTLYIYEFDSTNFYLQDEIAGYYVSEKTEIPINRIVINDLFEELFKRKIEIKLIPNLIELSGKIKKTSLNWSMCRIGNAQKLE